MQRIELEDQVVERGLACRKVHAGERREADDGLISAVFLRQCKGQFDGKRAAAQVGVAAAQGDIVEAAVESALPVLHGDAGIADADLCDGAGVNRAAGRVGLGRGWRLRAGGRRRGGVLGLPDAAAALVDQPVYVQAVYLQLLQCQPTVQQGAWLQLDVQLRQRGQFHRRTGIAQSQITHCQAEHGPERPGNVAGHAQLQAGLAGKC